MNQAEVSVKHLSWSNFLAPLVVAVIVGMGASYITTKVQVGRIETRLDTHREKIENIESEQDRQLNVNNDLRQRVTRIETKIDLLLKSRGIPNEPKQ